MKIYFGIPDPTVIFKKKKKDPGGDERLHPGQGVVPKTGDPQSKKTDKSGHVTGRQSSKFRGTDPAAHPVASSSRRPVVFGRNFGC